MKKIKFLYKKAIVTGGAGFIGSHIIEELLNLGVQVISIDDYSAGKKENLNKFKDNKLFKAVKCDVTDYNNLKKYFKNIDIVFHEAASKKTICLKDPRRDLEVNGKGTFNILELSRDFGVKKVVHASTGSVYGEAQYFPQDEKHPLNPTSYYGVSKLAGERYAKAFEHLYNMDITILRYFHVYGPRQESSDVGGVVSIFGRKALNNQPPIIFGDGTQQRSFTYVKDIAAINLLVAQKKETKGEVYNCASGIKVTIKELADKILNQLNKSDLKIKYTEWTPGDIKIFDIDNSKLKKLGFNFNTNFEKGLKTTINWLKKYLNK
ncbi:SDR family NAD(P)-dependent oxidoreductase [Patescibacteria group bacterium]|nr:SDR family NAD(P)-dependent oxidoreductase [Patescibacteria group bacterium]